MLARQLVQRAGVARNIRGFAAVGAQFPAVEVDFGFPPSKVNLRERLAGKKTVVVGLPGAYTPL